jgi:hypothetical protein
MDNKIIVNGKEYFLEKIFRKHKSDKTKDSNGKLYGYPKKGKTEMIDKEVIIKRLQNLQNLLEIKNKFYDYNKKYDCLLCDKKNITTKRYYHNKVMWEDSLIHYIKEHDIEINDMFREYIYKVKLDKIINDIEEDNNILLSDKIKRTKNVDKISKKSIMILKKIRKNNMNYVKIDKRQLLILDALMIHGGFTKKYSNNKSTDQRYSEHAGLLDFEKMTVQKIIVAGNTSRIDTGDDEIFLPLNIEDMFDYEYIFHTHPPTPKEGGRVKSGILYEFPSMSDIFHFIDHHNDGKVIGSIVVCAEGLYNIRKNILDRKIIDIDEDDIYKKYQKIIRKVQKKAIDKYGSNFSRNTFYSKISQDNTYIDMINKLLKDYELYIDFFPRVKNEHSNDNEWILNTTFLPFLKK